MAMQMAREERGDPLARRQGGEAGPIDGAAGEGGQLTLGSLVEPRASGQQE
jgi:hypothetical protein